tara:strand:- start:80398 stop:81231 length:834 start_codon:yes stop_codon:yes gene_type:complete
MKLILSKPIKSSLISIALCLSFIAVYLLYPLTKKPGHDISQQIKAINFDSRIIKIASLGQHRMISSFLWIETLLNSDLEHYDEDDLENWMFLRFKTITDLDPYFYETYLYGGIYLSIIKDDEQGATYLYDHGLEKFPDDFYLNLNASFHYFYEIGEVEKSLKSLSKIYNDSRAPSFLPSLYARMQSTHGDLQSALALVFDLYKQTPVDSPLKDSYKKKIYALKAEIDLNCLNNNPKKTNCSKKDFYGNDYLRDENGVYKAKEKWELFRVKKKALTTK